MNGHFKFRTEPVLRDLRKEYKRRAQKAAEIVVENAARVQENPWASVNPLRTATARRAARHMDRLMELSQTCEYLLDQLCDAQNCVQYVTTESDGFKVERDDPECGACRMPWSWHSAKQKICLDCGGGVIGDHTGGCPMSWVSDIDSCPGCGNHMSGHDAECPWRESMRWFEWASRRGWGGSCADCGSFKRVTSRPEDPVSEGIKVWRCHECWGKWFSKTDEQGRFERL